MVELSSDYFNWMLMGALLLLGGRLMMVNKAWTELVVVMSLLACLAYLGLPLSITMLSLSLCLWLIVQNMKAATILACAAVIILLAVFMPRWLPTGLLVGALMVFLIKSWQWVNHKMDYFAMAQLLCLLGMAAVGVLGMAGWIYGLMALLLVILLVIDAEQSQQVKPESETRWLAMIEQSRVLERQRIYSNIHDEVGASLLQLIYQLDGQDAQKHAKSVMQKIRQSVADTAHYAIKFSALYEDVCNEVQIRLSSAGIKFQHQKIVENDGYLELEVPTHLTRMIREIISNVIRHADASTVRLEAVWRDSEKHITITDNGRGMRTNKQSGKGLNSIKKRAKKINAQVSWQPTQPNGTAVHIVFINND